jgi:hypothetical protein
MRMMIEEPQNQSIKCPNKKGSPKRKKPDIKKTSNQNNPTAHQREGRWEGKTKRGN